jgi:hypothetical protein
MKKTNRSFLLSPLLILFVILQSGAAEIDLPDQFERKGYIRLTDWKDIQVVTGAKVLTTTVDHWSEIWSKAQIQELALRNLDFKRSTAAGKDIAGEATFLAEIEYTAGGSHNFLTIAGKAIAVMSKSGTLEIKIEGYDDNLGVMAVRNVWIAEKVPGAEESLFEPAVLDEYTMKFINDMAAPSLNEYIQNHKIELMNIILGAELKKP